MLIGNDASRAVETVVRSLSTAVKTLRLYPPTSPMPRQAMDAASEAVAQVLTTHPTLPLVVARDGFTFNGDAVNCPGSGDFAGLLTAHEIAQVDFMPGCSSRDIAVFLGVLLQEPAQIRASGGAAAAIALGGAETIVVSEVALTTVGPETVQPGADIDAFLRELAGDERKLAAWLAAAAAGDPAALADGLAELARAVGDGGAARLEQVLGSAFVGQSVNARDAIVGLALNENAASPLLHGMLKSLTPHDLASSISDGLYAQNMLSMSNVLNTLTLGSSLDSILAELRPMLQDEGHTDRELTFLSHMLEARTASESALAERVPDFRAVAGLAQVDGGTLDAARTEVRASKQQVNSRTVNMMLSLLDQQADFTLWSRTLGNLAGIVPTLLAEGDLPLAEKVIRDLSSREARTKQPWPGLTEKVAEALERATGGDAMASLAASVARDASMTEPARNILKHVGVHAQQRFVLAALADKEHDGLAAADALLGRRLIDILAAAEPDLQWHQAGVVAGRLAAEADQRAQQAVAALAHRPDQRFRQEVARGLGTASSAQALHLLEELTRDPALEVAVAAVRSLGRTSALGAAIALDRVFEAIDAIGKDFPLAREVLGSLSRTPDPGATSVLQRIAGQRALIKRGHFAEIQSLAGQALASRTKGGALS